MTVATLHHTRTQSKSTESFAKRTLRAMTPPALRRWYWLARARRESARIRRGSHYESHVGAAIRSIVKPGWTCLDVGANRGLITIPLAELVGPHGHVHAFEPHPDNVRELRANLERFNLSERVHIHPVAVNDGVDDRVPLFAGRGESASEWNIIGQDADGKPTQATLEVPTCALDAVFNGDVPVHFVKIDVEGAESLVLEGMQQLLWRQRPTLIIECHSQENWQACMALGKLGYKMSGLDGRAIQEGASAVAHLVARPVEAMSEAA